MVSHHHTDEALQAAWHRRKRPGWPPSFERVMADPFLARLVRLEADILQRSEEARAKYAAAHARKSLNRTSTSPNPHMPPSFDRKRAASGEREDD